jgi:hypothetical protein
MADLSSADYISLKDIVQLTHDIHEHIEDRLIKKTAIKYWETVNELMMKKPEYLEEQERKKQQVFIFI